MGLTLLWSSRLSLFRDWDSSPLISRQASKELEEGGSVFIYLRPLRIMLRFPQLVHSLYLTLQSKNELKVSCRGVVRSFCKLRRWRQLATFRAGFP
jgi:hypothetical protein